MKLFLCLLLLLILSISNGQDSKRHKADSLNQEKIRLIQEFLNLSPNDIIADIGSGSGYSLIPIANHCPTCKFTVEDIDSSTCNPASFLKKINKSGNKTNIENFNFVYGTEKTTNLPTANFNKVLIFDVIHELTYKEDMLLDIKRIMQQNGSIFIEEILVRKKVKKNKQCNYPFLTETEFKKLLAENNLHIKKEKITFDTGKTRYIKLFEAVFTN